MDVAGSYIHNMNSPVCIFSLLFQGKIEFLSIEAKMRENLPRLSSGQ